ncbi:MAG: hypothetical protein ACP5KY_09155 [Thermoproteus sp.]
MPDLPGIEVATADNLPPIDDKIVVVVGDRELAERLGAAYMSEEEISKFIEFLKGELARAVLPA